MTKPFYLDEVPGRKGYYSIYNRFDIYSVKSKGYSYWVLTAALLGMTHEAFLIFMKDELGAQVERAPNARYASIYSKKTSNLEKLIDILNKKFEESWYYTYGKSLYEE